jgi:hypothetical protein
MEKRTPSSARLRLFAAIVVPASLLIGYLLMEAGYRGYLYFLYVIDHNYFVTTVTVRPFTELAAQPGGVYGNYQPHRPITFSSYDGAGRLLQRHTIRINNYGWPSEHDYSRTKLAGEFRIAIVGDSMTASINNERPWPDVLQRHLNADRHLLNVLDAERISVLNLGVVGASVQFMANPLAVVARRFSADLVVMNFIGDDLARRHGDVFSKKNPVPALVPEPATVNDAAPQVTQPDLVIDGVGIDIAGCPPPRDLSNPTCSVSPYFLLPEGRQLDTEELNRIKSALASRAVWSRIITSTKPLLLLELMGRPAVKHPGSASVSIKIWIKRWLQGDDRPQAIVNMRDTTQSAEKEQEDLEIGIGAVKFMKAMHKELMLTHNPLYWYLIGQMREPAVDRLNAALSREGIEVTRLVKYLPGNKGEQDWVKWYNLPYDGHWSDLGAEIYGEAMYKAIRERLLETRRKSAEGPSVVAPPGRDPN